MEEQKNIKAKSAFELCRTCTKAADALMLVTGGLSILLALPTPDWLPEWLSSGFMIASSVLLLVQFIVQAVSEIYFYPEGEESRVLRLLGSALDVKITDKRERDGYFNNSVKPGLDNLTADYFENSFFTLNIAKKKTTGLVVKNIILLCIFLVAARIGMDNNMYLAGLQLFLSPLFLWSLFKHLYFVHSVKKAHEGFELAFQQVPEKQFPYALRYMISYEKALSSYGAMLDPYSVPEKPDRGLYNQLNPVLSKEWDIIAAYYGIR